MASIHNNNPDELNSENFRFLIVNPQNGGIFDLFKFMVFNNQESAAKFVQLGGGLFNNDLLDEEGGGVTADDRRWVIIMSVIARKIIKILAKPMECTGFIVEFILNLLSLNGNFLGLLQRFFQGNVQMPKRNSETFVSAIGHLDGRLDLFHKESFGQQQHDWQVEMGNGALMDLCMMASKLSYENAKVVRNVVDLHWKMSFVGFYNCWNDYQKETSTQVFIMCDKPKDANLIIITFRGTEPFDADDWITDFDYSWYEIPKLGKIHMGFLEALGLGNRANSSTFQEHLQVKNVINYDSETTPLMGGKKTAYYVVRRRLKDLLKRNENAKFVVTGHSLGGALAVLFPTVLVLHKEEDVMKRLLGVYTYGQPRVGDRQLRRFMEAHLEYPKSKYMRVVYCNDLVPRLPYDNKTFLYKHFGICLYYNSLYIEKYVDEEPNRNYFGLLYLIPEYINAGWELVRSLTMGYIYGSEYKECWESFILRIIGLALPGFAAHSPVNYVNSVRLGRKRSVEMMQM